MGDGDEYGGRTLQVNLAGQGSKGKGKGEKGKGNNELTAFVRGLPYETQEEELRKFFGKCGEIANLRMPLNKKGKCKSIAFVEFMEAASFEKAKEFNETEFGGRTMFVSQVDGGDYGGRTLKANFAGQGSKGKAFVRGLPFGTQEEELRKFFGKCGEIANLRMPLNDEGKCKGTAFVEFKEAASLEKAKKFNETEFGGRTIFVSKAGEGGEGKGKDGKGKEGKGKDGKGKGKDGKGKSKGKDAKGKGKKGKKQTVQDSDDE